MLETDPSAVALDDLTAQGEAEPAAGLLGRVERQKRALHGFLVHSATAVKDLDAGAAVSSLVDAEADLGPAL